MRVKSKVNFLDGVVAAVPSRKFPPLWTAAATLFFAATTIAQQPAALNWKDAEDAIKRFRVEKGLKVELWAAEPFVVNPVAFCFDERGRCFLVETNRYHGGTLDIREHMQWLKQDLASRTVEDRDKLQRRMFAGKKHEELERETERVRLIEDTDGDGRADRYTIFAEDFKGSLQGLGAGVLARKGNVWFTCIPDLWLLRDNDGDGKADSCVSLQYGYGVRNAFLGHDLHGLRFGPDGKLYFSIGDRGLHVTKTPDGRTVSWPDSGAVLRCNADGTGLELFAVGLRNPQALAFDAFGNLWTGDNNCDQGDAARLVYIMEGGDIGWRNAYQSVENPQQRSPWHTDKLWHVANKDQPAYQLPPVAPVSSGPSGFTFTSGVGLPERFSNSFLLVDFRGGLTGSGVHSFKVSPKGAGFTMINRKDFVWDICATDVEIGNDSAVYISDWVEGWGKPNKGRLYRVFDPMLANDPLVIEVKKLIAEGMEKRSMDELGKLLAHADIRIRQEAQFELAARGDKSLAVLTAIAQKHDNQFARLHAIWALGQIAQKNSKAVAPLVPLLKDPDAEVRAQAVKILGERRASDAFAGILPLLKDESPRVRSFAAMALGKLGRKEAVSAILEMANENAGQDPWLRHAAAIGLAWIGDAPTLAAASKSTFAPVRMVAVVALRKLARPEVAVFLNDSDEKVVLEAARAIYDVPIDVALPQLGSLVANPKCPPAVLPRALNANLRVGTPQAVAVLAAFAARNDAPESTRAEAVKLIASWASPDWRDRVTGFYSPLPDHDAKPAADALRPQLANLLRNAPVGVKLEAVHAAGELNLVEALPLVNEIYSNSKDSGALRAEALKVMAKLGDPNFATAVVSGVKDKDEAVRKEAVARLQKMANAAEQLEKVVASGTLAVRQIALAQLGELKQKQADDVLAKLLDQLLAGKFPAELQLDLLEAAAKKKEPALKEKLQRFEAARPTTDPLAAYREVLTGGNAEAGRKIFFERQDAMCLKCHKVKGTGGDVGPDMAGIGGQKSREKILEGILFPNKEIAQGFENNTVSTKSGDVYAGIVKSETAVELVLSTPDAGIVKLSVADIQSRKKGLSPMPEDVAKTLSKRDLRDLVEYLSSLKQK